MYLSHFGLTKPPFKITPDTHLFFKGNERGAALDALVYATLNGEGITKVVGEVGSGKTMLCRMLELALPETVEIIYIANPSIAPEDILHVFAFELNLDVKKSDDRLEVMQTLQKYLLEKHASGKQVVAFIEEAQGMPIETLEQIRLLSNLETSEHKLLQMVLFGQPELDENLQNQSIRQLRERITYSLYLTPFNKFSVYEYLDFRMRAAGYKGPVIFNKNLAKLVKRYSRGLTRRINIIADKALLAAYAEERHSVLAKDIKRAARDSEFGLAWLQDLKKTLVSTFAVALFALCSGTLLGSLYKNTGFYISSFRGLDHNRQPLAAQHTESARPMLAQASNLNSGATHLTGTTHLNSRYPKR